MVGFVRFGLYFLTNGYEIKTFTIFSVKVAVFLTNFHVKKTSLYQKDQTYYTDLQNMLHFIFNDNGKIPKPQQAKYVAFRCQRTQLVVKELFTSSNSDTESPLDES